MVTEWGAILIGFNALLWIFLPFYLRNGFYTVPEFLLRRFSPGVRTLYAALIVLTYLFVEIGAVLYLGALALNSIVGVKIVYSVIVLAVVTGAYTIVGGLRAVVWTEMLQLAVLLTGGLVLTVATLRAAGGVPAFLETRSDWHLLMPASDPDFPWTMYLGGSLCISTFYAAANQFIVQRALAAKNEWHARMGIVFTDYLKFIVPLIIIVPGLLGPRLFPNLAKPDLIFPTLVENLLPVGLIGLVMAALVAAVMGHTSGAINSVTTIATMDFYLPWRQRRGMATSEGGAVTFGRICGIVAIAVGIVCAQLLMSYSKKPVFLYLLNAYGYFTPGIATMFLVGILWKRATAAGALAAGFVTIPLSLALQWKFPKLAFQNRTGIVFWSCILLCVVVSLLTTPRSEEELKGLIWTPASLRLPPDQRAHYRGLRRPGIWWAIITAVVLFFYIRFA
jgi:SSS family solute:Na+ symporter